MTLGRNISDLSVLNIDVKKISSINDVKLLGVITGKKLVRCILINELCENASSKLQVLRIRPFY